MPMKVKESENRSASAKTGYPTALAAVKLP